MINIRVVWCFFLILDFIGNIAFILWSVCTDLLNTLCIPLVASFLSSDDLLMINYFYIYNKLLLLCQTVEVFRFCLSEKDNLIYTLTEIYTLMAIFALFYCEPKILIFFESPVLTSPFPSEKWQKHKLHVQWCTRGVPVSVPENHHWPEDC